MTLRELRRVHPGLFHPNQDWFRAEPFMDQQAIPVPMPDGMLTTTDATVAPVLMSAASLCALYVTAPELPIWSRYLWTADKDHKGQRVYIGNNGHGLEIHRHLHLTERWGCPLWS
jgi:hypothetical protein